MHRDPISYHHFRNLVCIHFCEPIAFLQVDEYSPRPCTLCIATSGTEKPRSWHLAETCLLERSERERPGAKSLPKRPWHTNWRSVDSVKKQLLTYRKLAHKTLGVTH